MIKVDVRNMTAQRVDMPAALVGLDVDTLNNLQSRLNPVPAEFVGIEFWPAVEFAPPIDYTTHKLGAEVLTLDPATKTVKVSYVPEPLSADELSERLAQKRAAIQAEIDRLEGYPNYLNRGARELQLRLMEKEGAELAAARGLTKEQVLAATPYYVRLKALDEEIKVLRVQL